jgi:hypothetical protein
MTETTTTERAFDRRCLCRKPIRKLAPENPEGNAWEDEKGDLWHEGGALHAPDPAWKPPETAPFVYGVVFCGADWVSDYFGGCHAHSRYRVERPGDGYEPAEACPAHLADMIAYLVDGDDVAATVHVRWDEEDSP